MFSAVKYNDLVKSDTRTEYSNDRTANILSDVCNQINSGRDDGNVNHRFIDRRRESRKLSVKFKLETNEPGIHVTDRPSSPLQDSVQLSSSSSSNATLCDGASHDGDWRVWANQLLNNIEGVSNGRSK
ncbi:unnamed protein product [Trichobilharzia regenti]|nr:unnamed protein product [Trichobilharzia regenti]